MAERFSGLWSFIGGISLIAAAFFVWFEFVPYLWLGFLVLGTFGLYFGDKNRFKDRLEEEDAERT